MSNILELNDDTFDNEVLNAKTPVLVDFSAVWCGPCKMLDPIVAQLAEDWGEDVKVVKLDIDHNPNVTMKYHVMGVPTLILFKSGEIEERITGFMPKDKILRILNPYLQPA